MMLCSVLVAPETQFAKTNLKRFLFIAKTAVNEFEYKLKDAIVVLLVYVFEFRHA
jgi:hypothetical protein